MPLTPQDVHSKVFGPTRFRRGYDEAEVDAFLDEVEAELTRLHREIDSLRAQVGGGGAPVDAAPADAAQTEAERTSAMPVTADDSLAGSTPQTTTAASAQAAAHSAAQQGTDDGNLEQKVARALVLAQRAADEAVRDAEQQAEELRRNAQTEAERIRAEAAQHAEQERRELEQTRTQAEDEVEQLRAFEREYRTRLRAYLEHQLRELADPNQLEADRPGALPSAADADGRHAAAAPQLPSDLPTSDLPPDDPAAVPHVAPPSEGPVVPPSVPVSDYSAPSGIGDSTLGDELRHERRDLHDGL